MDIPHCGVNADWPNTNSTHSSIYAVTPFILHILQILLSLSFLGKVKQYQYHSILFILIALECICQINGIKAYTSIISTISARNALWYSKHQQNTRWCNHLKDIRQMMLVLIWQFWLVQFSYLQRCLKPSMLNIRDVQKQVRDTLRRIKQ